ncbi:uncharacterized protein G2W53_044544 [Senna tora]|uniref:Uncharacterized protein n=1 Tax=Senna tora TaxID=362788 RepID=A0A834W068_9FABA|nr:uncharacterized protein G2W53_044544 [Senna tora]
MEEVRERKEEEGGTKGSRVEARRRLGLAVEVHGFWAVVLGHGVEGLGKGERERKEGRYGKEDGAAAVVAAGTAAGLGGDGMPLVMEVSRLGKKRVVWFGRGDED